jgi:hypothetical protein
MSTLFDQRNLGARVARASALCLLALAAALFQAREARAQWTAPDAQGNINSTNTGNVGVGTTTPPYTLTVVKDQVGTTAFGVFNRTDGVGAIAAMGTGRTLDWSDKYLTFGVTAPSFGVPGLNDVGILHSKGVPLKFGSESAHDILFFTNGYNNTRMTITGAGNVGIGTTTPGILNGANFTGYIPLQIQGQGTNPASIAVDSASPFSGLVINDTSQPVDNRMWSISQAAGGGKLTFRTYADAGTAASDRVVIDRSGKVGIGTTAPTTALHVVGDVTVTGNISAKYQDVAEWVPTTQKLAAGTVVVLDTGRDNHVLASHGAYDTRVAGVISAQPGLALGEGGEGKVLVATTGRVKVKVDASRGAIKIGDLIVTSDVAGLAMLSRPVSVAGVEMHRPGTIIGKALESLANGTGEILVLLSLQ